MTLTTPRRAALFASLVAAAALAACGESEAPADEAATSTDETTAEADPAVREAIETRQASLKELGASMKTISDEVKESSPDMAAITEASGRINAHAALLGTWFPEGTGPAAGIETEALDVIWEDRPGFEAAVARLQAEAGAMATAVASNDPAAVRTALPALGAACKNCHDNFRLQKN